MAIYKKRNDYYVDLRYGRGANRRRFRKCAGRSLREAEKAEARIRAMIAAGDWSFMNPKAVSAKLSTVIKRYLDEWSAKRKVERSNARDKSTLEMFRACVGDKCFSEIARKDVEKYVSMRLEAGVKNDTVNRELHTIKHMFTKAVEWEEVEQSVAHKVKPLPGDPERLRYLTKEEANRLLDECGRSGSRNLYPMVLTALFTGARRGELFSMTWQQVDFTNRCIKIIGTKNRTFRIVPMLDEVYECLSKLPRHIKSEFVFFGKDGEKLGHVYTAFWKAVERTKLEDFRFHDLRHTYASWLAINGVGILTIKELLGHKSIKMTLRYAHLSPDNLSRTREVLADYWHDGAVRTIPDDKQSAAAG